MDILRLINDKLFLGQEFLTWLWYVSEEEGPQTMADGRQVDVLLGDSLLLGPALGQEGTRVAVKGREDSLAEARQALRRGKLVEGLRLGLVVDGEEFWLKLTAAELAPAALRLPAGAGVEPGQEGREGHLLERIYLTETALRAMEGLLLIFLQGRLEDERGGELWAKVRAWASRV
jgi:recombination associated protein RdgC